MSQLFRDAQLEDETDEKPCAMTVRHRVDRNSSSSNLDSADKPQGSEQASSVKGKPQSHAPPTSMRTGPLRKQSRSLVTNQLWDSHLLITGTAWTPCSRNEFYESIPRIHTRRRTWPTTVALEAK